MRRSITTVVVLAAFASGALLPAGARTGGPPPAPSETLGHARVERRINFRPSWEAESGSDFSNVATLISRSLKTPSSAEAVDVVVTVTLLYRVSKKDSVAVGATLRPGGGGGAGDRLNGGLFTLRSPSGRSTSTTLMWVGRDVPAGGKPYLFSLSAHALDGNDPGKGSLAMGRKLTYVVEMWPAGP
jgi:hypothetical protein